MRAAAGTIVVMATVACGDNLPAGVDARSHDAHVFVPGPNVVTIYTTEDTTEVRCRNDGKGPWGYADKISRTEYQIQVNDVYEVIVGCGSEWSGGETVLHAQTFSDGDSDFLFCSAPELLAPLTFNVTGQMLQPGIVSMWDTASSSIAPWTYSLEVYKGLNDLVALDSSNRIAIRRDINVTEATTLATLDMAQEGTLTLTRPFTVVVPGGAESLEVDTTLVTANGFMSMRGTPTQIREVPPSVLQPGDFQFVDVWARTSDTSRYASLVLDTTSSVTLMPTLLKTSFVYSVPDNNTLRADFKSLPPFTSIDISLYDVRSAQHATYSRAWFEAMQRAYFELDFPPDFNQTWRVSLRPEYYRFVYVEDYGETLARYSSRSDRVTNVLGN
jgi:hypothetical protein